MLATVGKVVLFLLLILIPLGLYIFVYSGKVSKALNEGVTVSAITVEDKVGNVTLSGNVWVAEKNSLHPVKGVILLSHGFSSRSRALQRYAASLARDGFIVAGLNHDDIKGLKSELIDNDPFVARSRHLSLLLNAIKDSELVAAYPDIPVGFVGFSIGSFGVLSAMGVTVDFAAQENHCSSQLNSETDRQKNVLLCNPRVSQRINRLVEQATTVTRVESSNPSLGAVVLAPAYLGLLSFDNTTDLGPNERILMISGENDAYIEPSSVSNLVEGLDPQSSSGQNISLQLLKDAGHYVFLEKCPPLLGLFSEICKDPVRIDRSAVQSEVAEEILSFFNSGQALAASISNSQEVKKVIEGRLEIDAELQSASAQ